MFNLALCYQEGKMLIRMKKAFRLYQLATLHGVNEVFVNLVGYYQKGKIVKQNLQMSHSLILKQLAKQN
jgi:TPR repeat protein